MACRCEECRAAVVIDLLNKTKTGRFHPRGPRRNKAANRRLMRHLKAHKRAFLDAYRPGGPMDRSPFREPLEGEK